ncbi:glycosyltransferase [Solirubrobacter ginsenosidimutans]|uniref:Glycosyltransferase n=1 Tax=Solirubrobacter ginsenosidimutans TaxID=490573 RepID=A0A9X3MUJ0_9ACTN|nr:glycosyltransferase [Solirubrobacter ginsenosidimutans]MDA0160013.1 glycosyltransferase [Solirubrobacter ginsenosidimutans]
MKILLHSNAPWSASGYGQQAAMFAPRLADIHEVGISAFQGLTGSPFDFGALRVYPGSGAGWGNEILRPHAERHFGPSPGLVITLVDVFVLEPSAFAGLNVACWTPVDHDPAPPAVPAFFKATGAVPIAMSRFGSDRLSELDPLYIPHGVATDVFTPQDRGAARAAARLPADAFVVGIVAVNKGAPSRKSLAEMIEAFAIFRQRHDDAILYLHTELSGMQSGTHLPSLIEDLGIDERSVIVVDQYRYLYEPFAPEDMAATYATFDVLFNASMGEGFGLTVLEAQACGVPAIVTDFTAMREVCGAGWKVGYERYWSDQSSWQARPRLEELVESLEACYAQSAAERSALAAQAREHALPYDADRVLEEYWAPALSALARRFPGIG